MQTQEVPQVRHRREDGQKGEEIDFAITAHICSAGRRWLIGPAVLALLLSMAGRSTLTAAPDRELLFELRPECVTPAGEPSAAWRQGLAPNRDAAEPAPEIAPLRIPAKAREHPLLRNIFYLELPEGVDGAAWLSRLEITPGVIWAEEPPVRYTDALPGGKAFSPDGKPRRDAPPDDPYYHLQWALSRIYAPAGWDITRGDTGVVMAIVDVGVDFSNSDLAPKRWTNWTEKNGQPGIDDDGNGFVDDLYGWDFYEDDADPSPVMTIGDPNEIYLDDHASHAAGIAAAATDNGYGVSGVGWNCKLMNVRVGSGRVITRGYEGIIYAAANGADAICLSWGGGSVSNVERITTEYAIAEGAVIAAAAGNIPDVPPETEHFPAAYDSIIAVAGTTEGDVLADFSNYGDWVDIAAPGNQIISTLRRNRFGLMSGTSMSTPMVAAAAALVKSLHRDWTPEQIKLQLVQTADPIDDVNPGFEGKIGSGRLNLYRALADERGGFEMLDWQVVDDGGNGLIDPGERFNLVVTLRNDLTRPVELHGTLKALSDYIRVEQNSADFGSAPPRVSLDNSLTPFRIRTLGGAIAGQEIPCVLTLTGAGMASQNIKIPLVVRQPWDTHRNGIVALTVTDFGSIGYYDYIRGIGYGSGFRFPKDGLCGLFHGSLMIGAPPGWVSDCAYGNPSQDTVDFVSESGGMRVIVGDDNVARGSAVYSDENAQHPLGVKVTQSSISYPLPPDDGYVLMEYQIHNESPDNYDSLYIGLFMDWDIVQADNDVARWDAGKGAGWMEYARPGFPVFGAALISPDPTFNAAIFNRYIGDWDDTLKLSEMQSGFAHASGDSPDDYSQLIGVGPISLASGSDFTATFALVAGADSLRLLGSLSAARSRWEDRLQNHGAPIPRGIQLLAAYPSPFNGSFSLRCQTDIAGAVRWSLYDPLGRTVGQGGEMEVTSGHFTIPIAVPALPSGYYLVRVNQASSGFVQPVTLLK